MHIQISNVIIFTDLCHYFAIISIYFLRLLISKIKLKINIINAYIMIYKKN